MGSEDFREDTELGGGHFFSGLRGGVVVAGEVEESVDDVEGEFGGGGVVKLGGAGSGNGSADENFSVGEGDDICRPRDVEEIAVDAGHGASAKDGNVDAVEMGEGGVGFFGDGEAVRECGGGKALEVGVVVTSGLRAVGEGEARQGAQDQAADFSSGRLPCAASRCSRRG